MKTKRGSIRKAQRETERAVREAISASMTRGTRWFPDVALMTTAALHAIQRLEDRGEIRWVQSRSKYNADTGYEWTLQGTRAERWAGRMARRRPEQSTGGRTTKGTKAAPETCPDEPTFPTPAIINGRCSKCSTPIDDHDALYCRLI